MVSFFIFLSATALSNFVAEYKVLNLPVGSDFDQVKSAYRREALKWHPDQNSDPTAQDQFIRVNEAYERLKEGLIGGGQTGGDAFAVFKEFMGGSFGVSFGGFSGSSRSSTTVFQNGRKITKTVVTDLGSGRSQTTISEENIHTGEVATFEL